MTTTLNHQVTESATEELVRRYATGIVKKIMSQIESNEKKREKATQTKMDAALTANGVRSMKHWKATSSIETFYEENERLFEELLHINSLTNFTTNLHQDRYKFVEKYPFALTELMNRV
ncbi:DUF1140 family protein [Exiguobacterium sp. SH5S4]|uniref:DUF1140 family protein n=1 Tax=Exiguobacterium sp. SH5S4 TaxID=2510961 RepID=UPI00137598E9|nr:DUF1140 family protein [Exiguobacterium sp. SH5S4]